MGYRNRLQQTSFIALIMLATAGVTAQDQPDFSGRWVLAATPQPLDADVPLALSVRQTLVRTTVRGGATTPFFRDITIGREFKTYAHSDNYLIGVIGGGVPGRRADGSPTDPTDPTRHYAVTWDGNALVFESGSHTGQRPETGVWRERRETWSLDGDGRLRVLITTRSSEQESKNVTLLYRRP